MWLQMTHRKEDRSPNLLSRSVDGERRGRKGRREGTGARGRGRGWEESPKITSSSEARPDGWYKPGEVMLALANQKIGHAGPAAALLFRRGSVDPADSANPGGFPDC